MNHVIVTAIHVVPPTFGIISAQCYKKKVKLRNKRGNKMDGKQLMLLACDFFWDFEGVIYGVSFVCFEKKSSISRGISLSGWFEWCNKRKKENTK